MPRLVAAAPRAAARPGPIPPPATPKEPYVAIAGRPGLRARAAVWSAVFAGLFGAALGWDWPLVYLVPWRRSAVALSVIDWRTRLLPTWLIAPAYLVLLPVLVVLGADHPGLVGPGAGAGGWAAGAGLLLAVLAVHAQR